MKTYQTYALGFPITIVNPKFKTVKGIEILDLDFNALSKIAFRAILKKPNRLTGGEIKFIRNFLKMTQCEFAEEMGLRGHSQVSRWEKFPNKPTKMEPQQEYIIRLKASRIHKMRITNEMIDIFDLIRKSNSYGEPLKINSKEVA